MKRKSPLDQARKMLKKMQKEKEVVPVVEQEEIDPDVVEDVTDSETDSVESDTSSDTEEDVFHYLYGNETRIKKYEPVVSEWDGNVKVSLTDVPKKTLLKERLKEPFDTLNKKLSKKFGGMTPVQEELWKEMTQYRDILYTIPHDKDVRHIYALHALNHVYKTRDRVLKNKEKLKKDPNVECRDQGFTRPKVLILVPFRHHCFEIVQNLITLSDTKVQENKNRFLQEFEEDVEPDPRKSDDYNETFKGNVDDCFKIGVKFSRRQMKLFSPFYSSDIIIASPLGLAMIIGQKGYYLIIRDKKRDFDYLSSIEMLIMDQSDIFLMQNWDHVQLILDHLNLIPTQSHGCDFSRVRTPILDGNLKLARQTMVFTRFPAPEFNLIFNSFMTCSVGKVRYTQHYRGLISDVVVSLPQVFHRVPNSSAEDQHQVRFDFFTRKVLPTLKRSNIERDHTLILVTHYFEYLKLTKYLEDHNYSFEGVSEYSSQSQTDRSRHDFQNGESKILVYTERCHFFRRIRIKNVKHIVFYSPPLYHFYSDFVNLMQDDIESTCDVVYSRFDRLRLERIVGSERIDTMIKGEKDAYMFAN